MIKKGPWTVKKEIIVYRNKWMEVRENEVIRPDGLDGIFGTVGMNDGAMVLPMDDSGNVFLVEQYRFALGKRTIEVPCGGIEKDENPLEAAKRELKEEAGIEAKEWIELGNVDPLTSILTLKIHLFLAKNLNFIDSCPEGTEDIKVIKVSLDQAIEWVMNGKISSSVSAIMILKAKNSIICYEK